MGNEDGAIRRAYVSLIAVFFCWGSVYVANRYILAVLTPMELAFCRFFLTSLAIGVGCGISGTPMRVQRKDMGQFLFIGFVGYYLSMEFTLLSVRYTNASVASLINSLNPVFITVFAAFVLGEKLTLRKLLCLVSAIIGVAIVSGGGMSGVCPIGLIFGVLSILTWAWTAMYNRRLSKQYHPLAITFWGTTISLVFHLPTAIYSMGQTGFPTVNPPIVLAILYSGLIGTAIPQFLWNYALSKLPAGTCSMFYSLMPVFSALLGVLLLHETLGAAFYFGGILIVSTVVLSCLSE